MTDIDSVRVGLYRLLVLLTVAVSVLIVFEVVA